MFNFCFIPQFFRRISKRKDFATTQVYHLVVTVYIEVVILNNLLVDLFLGVTTCVARRRKIKKVRQVIAALLGAVAATAYVVLPPVAQVFVRILLAPLLVIILDKYCSPRDYLCSLGIFLALTFALGGVVIGTEHIIGFDIRGYLLLALVAGGALALELFIRAIVLKRANAVRQIKAVEVGYKGRILRFQALSDSGNSLTDEVSGMPVVILSSRAEMALNGASDDGVEIPTSEQDGFITVKGVGGESTLPLVKLDGIAVDGKRFEVYGALARKDFEDFDLILQNTIVG